MGFRGLGFRVEGCTPLRVKPWGSFEGSVGVPIIDLEGHFEGSRVWGWGLKV